jgi:hypothetical protein
MDYCGSFVGFVVEKHGSLMFWSLNGTAYYDEDHGKRLYTFEKQWRLSLQENRFDMVEFRRTAFAAYAKAHPDQWRGVHGLWDLIAKATAAGELELPREDLLFFGTPHAHEVSVNSSRVTGVSASTSSGAIGATLRF